MTAPASVFWDEYAAALRRYLEQGGEEPLFRAYEIGRRAVASGLGVLEVAAAHQEALVVGLLQILAPEESAVIAKRSSEFFAEALAPFEVDRRGFHEANTLLRDVNEELRRRVEAALASYRVAQDKLEERRRIEALKDEFISMVSHELRTPLTSIHGSLGLISAKFGESLPPSAKQLVEIAHRNSQLLKRLVDNVLDLHKMESGALALEIRTLELRTLLEQAIDANQPYAAQFGVRLQLQEPAPGLQVAGDSDRVIQVLTNLLSNAAKFSPPRGTVLVAAQSRPPYVRVTVTDRGPGVPAWFRERLFQRFAQADSSTARPRGGTGLGLSISKAILERMKGRIGFDAESSDGTTFYFDLPTPQEESEASPWTEAR
jgi:signal transduction histidine kinase